MWYGSPVVRHGQLAAVCAVPGEQAPPEALAGGRNRQGSGGHRPHIISRVQIYTKTGDSGETSLFDNTRVSKADVRVDAYGEVDELNAYLGAVVRVGRRCRSGHRDRDDSEGAVRHRRAAGRSAIADRRAGDESGGRATRTSSGSSRLIDALESELPPLRRFILPGGSSSGALLHLARTVCRRAERRVVALGADAVDPIVIVYLNRLSDLLFVMARAVNHRAGVPEIEW